mmetsp:Transcript_472/g.1120  ORF Transcript_472/g.1120 Transcript_472/m.1120 type:complete len:276 (+) Transcript_472:40-867(+)|eukprot:CAMPEP_0177657670 /NCGR_PEP_ID=MMETSP0447-20121125/16331_1 /TAXON_ID=0 /ORGANISM="Stygamoeba regulata, Strain BSH-02190019" /LENGTH=275 /DNA_ID=CAMNT_0019162085 /DNA_START=36 /DNA_END=863 /DNA_ORIENTATION=+
MSEPTDERGLPTKADDEAAVTGTLEEQLAHWREKATRQGKDLAVLQSAFEQFRTESSELEQQLEEEVQQGEDLLEKLKQQLAHANEILKDREDDLRELRQKSAGELHQSEERGRLLQSKNEELTDRVRQLEQANDQLTRKLRAATAVTTDLRAEAEGAREESIVLQNQLEAQQERHREENQRLRDELRDLKLELRVRENSAASSARSSVAATDSLSADQGRSSLSEAPEVRATATAPGVGSVGVGARSDPASNDLTLRTVSELLELVQVIKQKLQ